MKTTQAKILECICDNYSHRLTYSEAKEALEELADKIESSDDFWIELDGNEYRIISDSSIWEIYVEEIKNITEDCYSDVIKLDDLPHWLAFEIDWEQTAKNCHADGYGHTFAGYDGEEQEVSGWWIFRTN